MIMHLIYIRFGSGTTAGHFLKRIFEYNMCICECFWGFLCYFVLFCVWVNLTGRCSYCTVCHPRADEVADGRGSSCCRTGSDHLPSAVETRGESACHHDVTANGQCFDSCNE